MRASYDLIVCSKESIKPKQRPYVKDLEPCKDLAEVVRNVKPHVLIGTSTQGGKFTEEVVKAMTENTDAPLILPLSNPTDNSECTAEQAYKWSDVSAYCS